jgi:hypothetical protein
MGLKMYGRAMFHSIKNILGIFGMLFYVVSMIVAAALSLTYITGIELTNKILFRK